MTILLPPTTLSVSAASGDRTLYLHHTHTDQTGRFTFRRNGQYDQQVLRQLNVFLADWRTKEPTNMDPALFDLLWTVYQEVGATQPVNVVSSYRSPKTNAMLRAKSSAVAENSQHMRGKAMDFFIPGVNLTKLREVAMKHQVGGVGYYPTSGSPFVHLDTGNVRAWPRMTRAQLKKVFPDGRTLHLPTDGKPLSSAGRQYAQDQWQKCHAVPCNGRSYEPVTRLASLDIDAPVPADKPNLIDQLLGGGEDEQPEAQIQLASLHEPTQRRVTTIDIVAPVPAVRPFGGDPAQAADLGPTDVNRAPMPVEKSPRMMLATRSSLPSDGQTALSALADLGAPVPQPRRLMTNADEPEMVTAYVSPTPDAGAERALRMLIERDDTRNLPQIVAVPDADLTAASLGPSAPGLVENIFDQTFKAIGAVLAPLTMAPALAEFAANRHPNSSLKSRPVELVAPEIDHVNETLVHPVFMSSTHFAVMTEAEGYLGKETELGPLTARVGFLQTPVEPLEYDHFVTAAPLLVAWQADQSIANPAASL